MAEFVILYTTWPDAETAQAVAADAIAERLAACANLLAPMTAIFRWEGAVQQATETPMLLKTNAGAAPALRDFVLARHPYETPCVLALPIDAAGSAATFLAWMDREVSAPPT